MAGGQAPMSGVKQIVLPTGGSDDLIQLSDGTTIVDKDGNIDAPVTTTDLTVSGTLGVTGAATLSSTLAVTGLATLTAGIDAKVILASIETIAAGGTSTALDLTKFTHDIDADGGGDIFTLANGVVGQVTVCVLKTATGVATITPASFLGGTSVTLAAAGASVTFQYTANGWFVRGGEAATTI